MKQRFDLIEPLLIFPIRKFLEGNADIHPVIRLIWMPMGIFKSLVEELARFHWCLFVYARI